MLIDAFPKLKSNAFARLLRLYLASPVHMAVIACITLISSFFGWEVPAFYCYAAFTALAVFFGGDATGVLPVVGCGYMCISYEYRRVRRSAGGRANGLLHRADGAYDCGARAV